MRRDTAEIHMRPRDVERRYTPRYICGREISPRYTLGAARTASLLNGIFLTSVNIHLSEAPRAFMLSGVSIVVTVRTVSPAASHVHNGSLVSPAPIADENALEMRPTDRCRFFPPTEKTSAYSARRGIAVFPRSACRRRGGSWS